MGEELDGTEKSGRLTEEWRKYRRRVQCDPSSSHTFSSSAAVTWAVPASQRHYSLMCLEMQHLFSVYYVFPITTVFSLLFPL